VNDLVVMPVSGALSDYAKHGRSRSRLPRLAAVALAAAVLSLGTLSVCPQSAAAATTAYRQTAIMNTAIGQMYKTACAGYSFKSTGGTFSTGCGTDGWCATFAGWVWQSNGVDMKGLTYTPYNWATYGPVKSAPTVGDAVLFTTDSSRTVKSSIHHIAIVTAIGPSIVASVGGNQGGIVDKLVYHKALGSDISSITNFKYTTDKVHYYDYYVYGYVSPVFLMPVAPTSVSASVVRTSPLIVTVTWAESSTNQDAFTITRTNNTTGATASWPGVAASARSWSDGSASSGSNTYTVCAVNSAGNACSSSNNISV
jgi:hypothetical protein